MKIFIIFFVFLSCMNCSSQDKPETVGTSVDQQGASSATDPRSTQSHLQWSFADLSIGAFVVQKAFDGESNVCEIDKDSVFSLPQLYKSLVDEKQAQQKILYKKLKKSEKSQFWPINCEKDCSCDTWINFYESLKSDGVRFGAKERSTVHSYQTQSTKVVKNISSCLKDIKWFCQSQVLKDLLTRLKGE